MIKRIKLAKALLKFVDVVANDGTVITTEGELEVGKEVFTTDDTGEVVPLPTGEYEVNGVVVVVESGVITEMKEPTVEDTTEETPVEDTTEVMEEATEATEDTTETTENANTDDINDENTTNEVEDLKAEIEALKAENEALNAKIKELETELEKAKEPVAETIEEEFKIVEKEDAKKDGKIDFTKYINNRKRK